MTEEKKETNMSGLGFFITFILFVLHATETISITPLIVCLPLIIALLIDVGFTLLNITITIISALVEAKAEAEVEAAKKIEAECKKYGPFVEIKPHVFKNTKK